ncbi:MAG: hypothetical protein AAF513_19925 [Pseudomonadota bacterium]
MNRIEDKFEHTAGQRIGASTTRTIHHKRVQAPMACTVILLALLLSPTSHALLVINFTPATNNQTQIELVGSGMTGDAFGGTNMGFNVDDAPGRGDFIADATVQDRSFALPAWELTPGLILASIELDDDGKREDDFKLVFAQRGSFAAGTILNFVYRTVLPIDFASFNPGEYTDDTDANSKDLGGFRIRIRDLPPPVNPPSTTVTAPGVLSLLGLGLLGIRALRRARRRLPA